MSAPVWATGLALTSVPIVESDAVPIGEAFTSRSDKGAPWPSQPSLVIGTGKRSPREQALMEARNEARRIVARGLHDVIRWTRAANPADLLEGEAAAVRLWRAIIGDGRCPHPTYLQWRNRRGDATGCPVCGICWHRTITREDLGYGREVGYCNTCGEERRIEEWR